MTNFVNKITESNSCTRIEVHSNEHSSKHLSAASIFKNSLFRWVLMNYFSNMIIITGTSLVTSVSPHVEIT